MNPRDAIECLLLVSLYMSAGCGANHSGSQPVDQGANSGFNISEHEAIDYQPATIEQCPNGGGVYSLYIDQNSNGLLDAGETVLHAQTICNGINGSDGLNTLFSMNPILSIDDCASGSGLQISSGLDADRSGILDASEITQTQILCNGANGSMGAAGSAGSDGLNAVFRVVPAPTEICANGGSTVLMALDTAHTGVYSAEDPSQESATICNGANGVDAPISDYSTVEPILPCGNTVSYKEVLLRLGNGQVLASFSDNANGLNTRFAFIPDGSYVDTDGSGCSFQLSTSPDGHTRFMSWFNQVQKTWPMQ